MISYTSEKDVFNTNGNDEQIALKIAFLADTVCGILLTTKPKFDLQH